MYIGYLHIYPSVIISGLYTIKNNQKLRSIPGSNLKYLLYALGNILRIILRRLPHIVFQIIYLDVYK